MTFLSLYEQFSLVWLEFGWREFTIKHSSFTLALCSSFFKFFKFFEYFLRLEIKFWYSCSCNLLTNLATLNIVESHDSSMAEIFYSNLSSIPIMIFFHNPKIIEVFSSEPNLIFNFHHPYFINFANFIFFLT